MTALNMVNNTDQEQVCNKSTRVIRHVNKSNVKDSFKQNIDSACVAQYQFTPETQDPVSTTTQDTTPTTQGTASTATQDTTPTTQGTASTTTQDTTPTTQGTASTTTQDTTPTSQEPTPTSTQYPINNAYTNIQANNAKNYSVNSQNNTSTATNNSVAYNGVSSQNVPANNIKQNLDNNQLYLSHTNLIVKSVPTAVDFYVNAFNWSVIKVSEKAAVMQYNNYTFYLVAENNVIDYFGYSAVSPQTSGHSPAMTTTLLCDDVISIWNQALIAGAIPVKSPYKKTNGSTCATLVGPENYVWFITDSNNFFC